MSLTWTRWSLGSLTIALVLGVCTAQPAARSALETDPSGWTDLMPGKDLKGWTRVPIPPDDKLNNKNAWSVDESAKVLHCDGVGVKEILRCDREVGDGIFHVEWRFRKTDDKSGYNSGVYVRTSADGKIWHQAQVAMQDKRPQYGDLFGMTLVKGQPKMFLQAGDGARRAYAPGQWNTYEVTCKGKTVTVWVNDGVATTWNDCDVPKGHLGLQAEFYYIDFRNLKFKEVK